MLRHDDVAPRDDLSLHRPAASGGARTNTAETIPFPGRLAVPSIDHNPDGWDALARAVFSHPGRPSADLRDRRFPDAPVAPVIDLAGHRRRRSREG